MAYININVNASSKGMQFAEKVAREILAILDSFGINRTDEKVPEIPIPDYCLRLDALARLCAYVQKQGRSVLPRPMLTNGRLLLTEASLAIAKKSRPLVAVMEDNLHDHILLVTGHIASIHVATIAANGGIVTCPPAWALSAEKALDAIMNS